MDTSNTICVSIVTCENCGQSSQLAWKYGDERQACPKCGHLTQTPPAAGIVEAFTEAWRSMEAE